MKKILLILVVIVAVGAAVAVGSKNRFVAADEDVKAAWAQVENTMQRRADLIPNLVNTVKGYAKQEQQIFTEVAEARAKLAGAGSVPEKIKADQSFDSAISRLLVIAERYPDLKSNQNFMALQDELAGTENRIAVERRRFNEAVERYNVMVRQFPGSFFAGMFGFSPKTAYFQASPGAQTVPQVDFGH